MPRHTTFGESKYERQGQAGARSMEEDRHDRIVQAHAALEEAKFRRMESEALAKAKKATDLHNRLSASMPLLLGINPTDEDAEKRYYHFGTQHAADILEDPAAKQVYEQVGRQLESYKKDKRDIEARKAAAEESAATRKQLAEESRASREALTKVNQDFRKEQSDSSREFRERMQKEREESQKDAAKTLAETKSQAKTVFGNQRHQNDFDKAYNEYTGHLKTLQDSGLSSATPLSLAFLTKKNTARATMQTAADRIKAGGDPEAAKDIADKLKAADLEEHAVLEAKLTGGDVPTNANAKLLLTNEINNVKQRLGYWKVNADGHAVDEKGQPITDPVKLTSAPPWAEAVTDAGTKNPSGTDLPPANEADKAENSKFMRDATTAKVNPAAVPAEGAAATDDEPLSPVPAADIPVAPVNPNLPQPAGAPPAAPVAPQPAPIAGVSDATPNPDDAAKAAASEHAKALEWAKANPNHPKAKAILETASAVIGQ